MNRSLICLALFAPAPAAAQCQLCAPAAPQAPAHAPARPLGIEIDAALDLGRAAQGTGGGSIAIDERSGARTVAGLIDLGGFAFKGTVHLSGEPFAHVRIGLPPMIRLTAPEGGSAEIRDLRADLPPDPALDGRGELSFSFGGRLIVAGGAAGDFRGRVPVTAEYE